MNLISAVVVVVVKVVLRWYLVSSPESCWTFKAQMKDFQITMQIFLMKNFKAFFSPFVFKMWRFELPMKCKQKATAWQHQSLFSFAEKKYQTQSRQKAAGSHLVMRMTGSIYKLYNLTSKSSKLSPNVDFLFWVFLQRSGWFNLCFR